MTKEVYPVIEISEFVKPTKHPWAMLEDYPIQHRYEVESFLAWFLARNIEKGEFSWIQSHFNHDHLVKAGLLEATHEHQTYRLSNVAIKLLHKYYGKNINAKSN